MVHFLCFSGSTFELCLNNRAAAAHASVSCFLKSLSSCFAVFSWLLCLVHGHPPHTHIWLESCLQSSPLPLLPAPHFRAGPGPSPLGPGGPPGSLRALRGRAAQTDPPRLGEEPTHPLHPADRRLPQRDRGRQQCVRKAIFDGVQTQGEYQHREDEIFMFSWNVLKTRLFSLIRDFRVSFPQIVWKIQIFDKQRVGHQP